MKMSTEIATKFVTHDVSPLYNLRNSIVYKLREKINNGGKMTREEKDWLTNKVNDCIYYKHSICLGGYRFSFRDVLKRYLVNTYGSWYEYYAVDRTALRKTVCGISEIVEIK